MKILLLALLPAIVLAAGPLCDVCHFMVSALRKSVLERPTISVLEKIAVAYCVKKGIEDKTVCEGAIKGMTPFLIGSLWRHHTNPHVLCQDVFMCKAEYVKRNVTKEI